MTTNRKRVLTSQIYVRNINVKTKREISLHCIHRERKE
jgi:hypothetical protein